jgi:predicted RNase H-like HicB family nuclease
MKSIIQFSIYKGEKYYIASGVDLPIVTQAKTLDALSKNIQEAVELHLEGKKSVSMGLTKKPSVLINFELPMKLCLS